MSETLSIEIAFFEGDNLLVRCHIECKEEKAIYKAQTEEGTQFEITHSFELPASPVEIVCSNSIGVLYNAALRVGVHSSEDWESIELGNIHTLAFKCIFNTKIEA